MMKRKAAVEEWARDNRPGLLDGSDTGLLKLKEDLKGVKIMQSQDDVQAVDYVEF